MYYIVVLPFASQKRYISTLISSIAKQENIECEVVQEKDQILIVFDASYELIDRFLLTLEQNLPASIYLGKSSYYTSQTKIKSKDGYLDYKIPVNIAPCTYCQKEMFDVSSRYYYYPFTSCNHCGTQTPFMSGYPFVRANSFMKFMVPCKECQNEQKINVRRNDYVLSSCVECGIPLKMKDAKNERIANDKGTYRKLFEISAKALSNRKEILAKTPNGYRLFMHALQVASIENPIVMIANANAIDTHFMLIQEEFYALLSIERPLIRLATKSDEAKSQFGSSAWVKYPDEGISMLLAKEVMSLGIDYLVYADVDSDKKAEFVIDFDIPVLPQIDSTLFINQDTKKIISGERLTFPAIDMLGDDRIIIAHNLASVIVDGVRIIDSIERFEVADTTKIFQLEDEDFDSKHSNVNYFTQWKASSLSVLAENDKLSSKAVGVYFDEKGLQFLYYNAKEVINAIPSREFSHEGMFDRIANLRDGSDRLVSNYTLRFPERIAEIENANNKLDAFAILAILMGLKNKSLDGVAAQALSFLGKGGIQIDTHIKDNRFDYDALLASIMSYQLADVESSLLCYSLYESFGDYIGEIIKQLTEKTKTSVVFICGEAIANQILFGRIKRNLAQKEIISNINYPMGRENALHGALYL
ncbi:MAG: hypothetical protein PHE73_05370 [Sulfurovaceae bacterium]|nr:hypothetical protein [Sulfurovaceae bacterium]